MSKLILTPTTKTPKPKSRMTKGNVKVKALLFSLPPVQACLNHKSCASTCYAVKSYRQYPSVRNLWNDNMLLATTNLWSLYDDLRTQLKTTKQNIVRIHQSGDFISQAYVDMWATIATEFPNVLFYAYTKVDHLFDFSRFEALPNTNLITSMINGQRNYGSLSYVTKLASDTGAIVCPATHGENKDSVKCGLTCFHCMTKGAKVTFVQH